MTNPIADPLVEVPDTDTQSGLALLDATAEGVAYVTLNRTDKKNAFNADLILALKEVFETLHAAEGIRVVFLRGAGGMFSAGADLEWMRDAIEFSEGENRQDAMEMARMLKALYDLPALTVALVEGGAYGGGAGLAAACDMAIAVKDTKFAFSEVKLGIIAATISPYVIGAIGPRKARSLFSTARVFDANEAREIGLIDQVVADGAALSAAAEAVVNDIMLCAPGAVAASKALVKDVADRAIDHDLMEETAKRIAHARVSDEGQEGVTAFLARKRPSWAGGGD